ncbi:MAG: hypothetical protein JXA10_17035 [Anaerolineae bacterium]|nr:hypothetical protein [Anaerolineae bacterium]
MSADDQTTNHDEAANTDHEQNAIEMDALPPKPAAPQILGETPIGGVPKPVRATPPEIPPDRAEALRRAGVSDELMNQLSSVDVDDLSDSVNLPVPESPPVEDFDPDRETVPGDAESAELAQHMRRAMAHDSDSQELQKVTLEHTAAVSSAEAAIITDSSTLATEPDQPTTLQREMQERGIQDASDLHEKTPPNIRDEGEWDDEISPELAAVLFAGKSDTSPRSDTTPDAAPTDSAPVDSASVDSASAVPAASADTVTPAESTPAKPAPPPAEPIQLTSRDEARVLAITAEGHAAPAPGSPLEAKVRYVRIEEPLKDDNGQRTEETWTYFKGAYPSLKGRLVREVSSEDIQYADGSWKWTYERQYEDRGRDSREVRANAANTYFERKDTVSVTDAEGKRNRYEEEAEVILAPPETDEKRGGLLSSLFGRNQDDEDETGTIVWRAATPAETKQARRDGGDAFDRSLLDRLF